MTKSKEIEQEMMESCERVLYVIDEFCLSG